ncbi:Diacylglycerol kinase family enzyme [Devosia lucknowensis]|uniref:Diacylglycerol kinase family enzyme n=1 Tax=Devosia lucknowensis TaxID=1096929 RepID=A0A1Y6E7B1_9HYPH|nr:diacylglycerol kinase family protein [Devosia lucknowensis]SMQ58585.1 Diacylglycerol kinase family enzyme [Devosia lucknowensis]
MTSQRFYVLLNENSGTAHALGVTRETLGELFEKNGLDARIDADCSRSMDERIADAVSSDAEIVVAAGGDGTITALAGALVGSEKHLAILPLGTFNAVAKDLHLPLDLPGAVAALTHPSSQRIDVADVNGRVFLQKVVIGLIPSLAAGREHLRGRETLPVKIAFMRFLFRRLARARRLAVVIDPSDGERRVERIQALAVACNAYDEGLGKFFARESLDRGTLTLYILKHLRARDFFRLATGMMLGRWRDHEALSMESIQQITIDTRKPLIKVMFDGEIETFQTPLTFTIRPKALSVIVPAEVSAETETVVAA